MVVSTAGCLVGVPLPCLAIGLVDSTPALGERQDRIGRREGRGKKIGYFWTQETNMAPPTHGTLVQPRPWFSSSQTTTRALTGLALVGGHLNAGRLSICTPHDRPCSRLPTPTPFSLFFSGWAEQRAAETKLDISLLVSRLSPLH